ncbi:transient receptor potential cation channel subfamily A member 1 homolog [Macrobrachium rosenbergii]|uniref:transient receptor potential cation channel subfamily A member 1 homolog n=1 Tax=Macrobrachium rosenbergii TaxID=79674 RepID=UPI0034D4C66E
MASKKWKDIAYGLVHRNGADETDVEANTTKDPPEDQEKEKTETENTGAEEVAMKTLTVEPSAKKPMTHTHEINPGTPNGLNKLDHDDSKSEETASATNAQYPGNTNYSNSEIHFYASEGNTDKCLQLLARNANINLKGKYAMTPLHLASQKGHGLLVKELLNLGANRYAKDSDGLIPLHHAARQGYLNSVENLLAGNPPESKQLGVKSSVGRTPLMEAAESGSQEICKLLIGSVVDETDNAGNTALHLAVKSGYSPIVKVLLEKGANPKCQNKEGITPIHEGARQKTKKCLELLCESAKPDIFHVDNKGRNVIHFSVIQRSAECLKYLLEKEFVKNHIDTNGSKGTPLIYAMNCRTFLCINALLDAGASPTVDSDGTFPIHKAAEIGYYQVCEKLFTINDSILQQKNKLNQTALHLAAKSGNLETVDFICDKIRDAQVSPSCEDAMGQTALHLAVKKADEQVIRRLLRCNIASGKQDAKGYSPLHIAAEMGKTTFCELLVDRARTGLHKTDKNGYFPLDMAFKDLERNKETIIYLLEEMCSECPSKFLKNAKYLGNVMLLKCRMRKYMEKALSREQRDIVEAILQSNLWEDALLGKQDLEPENFKKLVEVYPSLALKVLGRCYRSQSKDEIHYNFSLYENTYYMKGGENPFDETSYKLKKEALNHRPKIHEWVESHPVILMISNNECDLLKHPVTIAWLRHKWNSYIKYIHSVLLFIDFLYLLALICLMSTAWNWTQLSHTSTFNISKEEFCSVASSLHQNNDLTEESTNVVSNATSVVNTFNERVQPYLGFYYWVTFSWVFKIIMELFYGLQLRSIYISREMRSHVITQSSQMVFTAMLIFCPLGMCYQGSLGLLQEDWSWQCGIFAVLMAWLHLINAVNQALTSEFLPIAKDFLEILLKVVYFLIAFVAIFAFIFHLLLLEKKAFVSVHQSIASTIVWMLLDLGYADTFVENELSYPILSNVIFFVFITTIGCLIVSLINKERTVKSRGKELDLGYRRLVIYTRLILRYDMCFPWFRKWCTVCEYTDSHRNQTLLEYYLGQVENGNATEESTPSEEEKICERIKKLESLLSEVKDEMFIIKRLLKVKDEG